MSGNGTGEFSVVQPSTLAAAGSRACCVVCSPCRPWADPQRFWLSGRVLAVSMLGLVIVSYARAAVAGTIKVDDISLSLIHRVWLAAAVATCLGVAGWFYLKACWSTTDQDLKRLLKFALLIHFCAFPALPLTSNDVFSNLLDGRLVLDHRNPYMTGSEDPPTADPFRPLVGAEWSDRQTPYGPVAVLIATVAAEFGGVAGALAAWKTLMLVCGLGTVLITYRFCQTCLSGPRQTRAFTLVAWNPLLAWEISGQAHNDGILVFGVAAFVWAATAGRPWLAVAGLLLALYAKFAVLPILGLYLVFVLRGNPLRAMLMVLVTIAAGGLLFLPFWSGVESLHGPWQALGNHSDRLAHSLVHLFCGAAKLFWPAAREPIFLAWSISTRVFCVALASVCIWRATSLDKVLRGSLIFLLVNLCLAAAWVLPWYATWLLPLAAGQSDARLQRIVAIYTVLVFMFHLPADGLVVSLVLVPLVPMALLWQAARRGVLTESCAA